MPSNNDISGYQAVFRISQPGDPHWKVRKRTRHPVSCITCRARKLKCDRQQPCGACVKRGEPEVCKFSAAGGTGGGGNAAAPVPRKEMLARLQKLEDLVNLMNRPEQDATMAGTTSTPGSLESSRGPPSNSHESPTPSRPPSASTGGHLSKKGTKVQFVGATNYAAVLECIHDLQGFVDTDFTNDQPGPATQDQQPERPLQDRQPSTGTSDMLAGSAVQLTIQDVMDCLPPKAECDRIMTFFFQQEYVVPVVIHTGQFQRAYENFWEDPNSTGCLWLSILFVLLSTAVFQHSSKDGCLRQPEVTEKISRFSSMALRCLVAGDYLQCKPYSVEAPLLYAMHLVLQKKDAEPICWPMFGVAVRLAQRMGYHRDAKHLGNSMTAFEGEMRRRAWYLAENFDLLFSFQLGVPPIIHGDDCDTDHPTNLRDEDFNENSTELPPTRPNTESTPILYYCYHSRQVRLLRRVIRKALAVKQPEYADILRLDADLRAVHDDAPPSLKYRPIASSGFADVPDIIMRRMLSEIQYLKCMCVLHRRYLTFERENSMYDRSREACRNASLRLLEIQSEFDEQAVEGGRLFEKRYMLNNMAFHDFLLAAMCLCLDLTAAAPRRRVTLPNTCQWSPGDSDVSDPSTQDRVCKISALQKAYRSWERNASFSKEAAHATKVLGSILKRVAPSGARSKWRSPTPAYKPPAMPAPSTSTPPVSTQPPTPNALGISQMLNPPLPGQGYSMEWDFSFDDQEQSLPLCNIFGSDTKNIDWVSWHSHRLFAKIWTRDEV